MAVVCSQVADKRKSLLDQLAMKYQEDSDQHREQLKEVKKDHESLVNDLSQELSQLKVGETSLMQGRCWKPMRGWFLVAHFMILKFNN